jgi:hypothetical protein
MLRSRLRPYSFGESLVVCSVDREGKVHDLASTGDTVELAAAVEADLLLSLEYALPATIVKRFRRSALLDIDPGLLQSWLAAGYVRIAEYDTYFSIGESIGQPHTDVPDAGIKWLHTPPCVALDQWPSAPPLPGAAFTTVSHWSEEESVQDVNGEWFRNDKRDGFLAMLELPRHTAQPVELAVHLYLHEEDDRRLLLEHGWRLRDPYVVAGTTEDYRRYIQGSLGEFSCVKPSCLRMPVAWISDRTLCYLASGKPAIVQHTGPSRFLPDAEGLFRFRTLEEAAQYLNRAATDYEQQCKLARVLAEQYFDARMVAGDLLGRALA